MTEFKYCPYCGDKLCDVEKKHGGKCGEDCDCDKKSQSEGTVGKDSTEKKILKG